MKLRKFMVYLDDGDNCYKIAIPAKDERDARKYVEGNGDIIAIIDITEDYPINLDKVIYALRAAGFGEIEIALINRTLQRTEIAE